MIALATTASAQLMRAQEKFWAQEKVMEVDSHSHFLSDALKHDPTDQEVVLLEDNAQGTSGDNPCSYLGCNSHTCAWASGGAITRVEAKKACSNALKLGSNEGTISLTELPDSTDTSAGTADKV